MTPTTSRIPRLGLGTFGRTGEAGADAIARALQLGFRHIDTAQSYDTESSVREGIARSGVPREEVFVTTKVADTNLERARFMPSVEASLETLGVEAVDLLLIHWPTREEIVPFAEYIEALGAAQDAGKARLIGVSNFPVALLERAGEILGPGRIATNQVEVHPYLQSPKLRGYCAQNGILVTAYMPLAKGRVLDDPVLGAIAEAHGVSVPTVTLAWLLQEGLAPIPASSREEHLKSNLAALEVTLTEAEMDRIRGLDRGARIIDPDKAPEWDD